MPHLSRRHFLQTGILAGAGSLCCGRLFGAATELRFGLVADAQYADLPANNLRHYRQTPEKLTACVEAFNRAELDFAIHLGDFIDRDFASYDTVLPIYRQLEVPGYFALGNHDYAVKDEEKPLVLAKLGMESRYYDFTVKGWRFAVLDGNEVGILATTKGSPERAAAEEMLAALKAAEAPHAKNYNGAVSAKQLAWLDATLADADARRQPAVVFCHFPVFPFTGGTLWNREEVIAVLERHPTVLAYINGHVHGGGYGVRNGIHYLTVNGMVDTADTTAYGVAARNPPGGVAVTGTGRLKNHDLAR